MHEVLYSKASESSVLSASGYETPAGTSQSRMLRKKSIAQKSLMSERPADLNYAHASSERHLRRVQGTRLHALNYFVI